MGFLVWIVVGLIAGWLAGQVMKGGGYGVLVDIILGILGGVVGGWVFGLLGIWPGGGMIGAIIVALEFGIEEEHSLDIAFRDDQTGEFYAFNSDNYTYPQMKKPEHLLAGQHFLVRISLLGPWVDETFEFLFANDSIGTKIMRPLPLS